MIGQKSKIKLVEIVHSMDVLIYERLAQERQSIDFGSVMNSQ